MNNRTPASTVILYFFALVFLAVSAYMLYTAVNFQKLYLESLDANFKDMWENVILYIIEKFVPYFGISVLTFGLGKAISVFSKARDISTDVRTENSVFDEQSPVAIKLEELRQVSGIKLEEMERREKNRLEETRAMILSDMEIYRLQREEAENALMQKLATLEVRTDGLATMKPPATAAAKEDPLDELMRDESLGGTENYEAEAANAPAEAPAEETPEDKAEEAVEDKAGEPAEETVAEPDVEPSADPETEGADDEPDTDSEEEPADEIEAENADTDAEAVTEEIENGEAGDTAEETEEEIENEPAEAMSEETAAEAGEGDEAAEELTDGPEAAEGAADEPDVEPSTEPETEGADDEPDAESEEEAEPEVVEETGNKPGAGSEDEPEAEPEKTAEDAGEAAAEAAVAGSEDEDIWSEVREEFAETPAEDTVKSPEADAPGEPDDKARGESKDGAASEAEPPKEDSAKWENKKESLNIIGPARQNKKSKNKKGRK